MPTDDRVSAPAEWLRTLLQDACRGVFPEPDARVEVIARPDGPVSAVLAFAAHHVVAADVDPDWVDRVLPPGDLSAPVSPPFLHALAKAIGAHAGCLDVVLTAPAAGGPPPLPLTETANHGHHRVDRAHRYRRDVRSWSTPGGVLVVGRGLAGRWEAAFEVDPAARGQGIGRTLAASARHFVPPGESLFIQVTPGNVPSLRAVLAAGFTPIGAEVLLRHPA
jgi:GNAT superfamily N-acetyltransferase